MADERHWNRVYDSKSADAVSWYAPSLTRSLEIFSETGLGAGAAVIDVGGGASTLPDELLDSGVAEVTVLDISTSALEKARAQLGQRAASIHWIAGDVTSVELPEAAYSHWHDRAVFHFLTAEASQDAYVEQAARAIRPGGWMIVATFGLRGPEKCSGLTVARYDGVGLERRFGGHFDRVRCLEDTHKTPWGSEQQFVYCLFQRRRHSAPPPGESAG
jgi:ubiquinone/menaquinone biosynthesis C-methylase UbiE